MAPGSTFQRYIPDPHPESLDAPEDIKRHIVRSVAHRVLTHTDTVSNTALQRTGLLHSPGGARATRTEERCHLSH